MKEKKVDQKEEAILAKYPNIPKNIALQIHGEFGTLQNYIEKYKRGEAPKYCEKGFFCGSRAIRLSTTSMTVKEDVRGESDERSFNSE